MRPLCLLMPGVAAYLLVSVAPAATEIPFRHLLIDRRNIGADCKAVGDLSGDGFPDVVVADNSGTPLQWYEYPSWRKQVIDARSDFTTDMQTADIDADGDQDVVVADYPNAAILWYRNPKIGGGEWKPVTIGPSRGHDVEVGDINRDKKIDVVVREGATTVFLQDRPASWSRIAIPTGGRGGTALGDLDRDGDLDLAQNGYWLECPSDPARGSWTRHEIAKGWPEDVGATVADMDQDGRQDVLLSPAESAGRLVWYEAPAEPKRGRWAEHLIADDVAFIHTFKVADMDRDRDPDVITAEMEQSPKKRVTLYRNEEKALRWRPQVLATTGSHNIRVADIGRDGDMDVIGANFGLEATSYSPVELWESLLADRSRRARSPNSDVGTADERGWEAALPIRVHLRCRSFATLQGRGGGEVDFGAGDLVEVVGVDVEGDVRDDLGDLAVGEAGRLQGGDVGVADAAVAAHGLLDELQCCARPLVGGGAASSGDQLFLAQVLVLADGGVRRQAIVALVDLADAKRDRLAQLPVEGAALESAGEVEIRLQRGRRVAQELEEVDHFPHATLDSVVQLFRLTRRLGRGKRFQAWHWILLSDSILSSRRSERPLCRRRERESDGLLVGHRPAHVPRGGEGLFAHRLAQGRQALLGSHLTSGRPRSAKRLANALRRSVEAAGSFHLPDQRGKLRADLQRRRCACAVAKLAKERLSFLQEGHGGPAVARVDRD
jgi:hypothetical protein